MITPYADLRRAVRCLCLRLENFKSKVEIFVENFLELNENEVKSQAPLLRDRVAQITNGKLLTEYQFNVYRILTQACQDETYELKNDKHRISLPKPLIQIVSEPIRLASISGIVSAHNQYLLENKYDKAVFDIIADFFSQGYLSHLTRDNVLDVFECAKELQIKAIEEACRLYLRGNLYFNNQNILEYVYWAEYNNEPPFLENCVEFIRKIPEKDDQELTPHFRWKELTPPILKLIKNGCVNLSKSSIFVSDKISDFKEIIIALNSRAITFQEYPENYQDFAAHIETILLSTNVTFLKIHLKKFETLKTITTILKKNDTVTTLEIGYFDMGDEGARLVADMLLENKTLSTLDLEASKISDKGAEAISEALSRNRSLRKLFLGSNKIGSEGAKFIAASLCNNLALYELNLGFQKMGKEGTFAIAEMLKKNKTLRKLCLYHGGLSDDDIMPLVASLNINSSLQEVDITNNNLSIKTARSLEQVLSTNTTLTRIDLYGNEITKKDADTIKNKIILLD